MTKHVKNNTQYLSTRKAALFCGISVPMFRQWKISGKLSLTPIEVKTTVFYNRDELEEQLQAIRTQTLNPASVYSNLCWKS